MTADLVKRLREHHQTVPIPGIASIYSNAADRLEALEADVVRLTAERDALKALVAELAQFDPLIEIEDRWVCCYFCEAEGDYLRHRVGPHKDSCLHTRAAGSVQEPQPTPDEEIAAGGERQVFTSDEFIAHLRNIPSAPTCSSWLTAAGSCRLAEGHAGPHQRGNTTWTEPGRFQEPS